MLLVLILAVVVVTAMMMVRAVLLVVLVVLVVLVLVHLLVALLAVFFVAGGVGAVVGDRGIDAVVMNKPRHPDTAAHPLRTLFGPGLVRWDEFFFRIRGIFVFFWMRYVERHSL